MTPPDPSGLPSPTADHDATELFSSHRRSAYGAVAVALGLVTVAEILGVHVLLSRWSALAAWIATALGLYGMMWIVADYRSVRSTPHAVGPGVLSIRRGTLWRLDAPLDRVASARMPTSEERAAPKGSLDLMATLPAAPWVVVTFTEPVPVRGPMGITKRVTTLGVSVDDPDAFRDAVRRRTTQRGADAERTAAMD